MKNLKIIISFVVVVNVYNIKAQFVNWQYIDTLITNNVHAIFHDTTDNSTYIGGPYYRIDTDTIWGIGKYKNGQWYRMGNGVDWLRTMPFCAACTPNPVKDIIKYNDTLYITGQFGFSGNTILKKLLL